MSRPLSILRTRLLWPTLLVVLGCFAGLLALQSYALPGELPRATLERTLGIDIAPGHDAQECSDPSDDSMPAMHAMSMGTRGEHAPPMPHDHHDGESCPLCPLLTLAALIPFVPPVLPGVGVLWLHRGGAASRPRAPPLVPLGLPPACGPPLPLLSSFWKAAFQG